MGLRFYAVAPSLPLASAGGFFYFPLAKSNICSIMEMRRENEMKTELIRLIESINDEKILRFLYAFVKAFREKWSF